MTDANEYSRRLIARRNAEFAKEAAIQRRRAELYGGCPMCFKPHDDAVPSCNRLECKDRWQQIKLARKQAAAQAQPASERGQP